MTSIDRVILMWTTMRMRMQRLWMIGPSEGTEFLAAATATCDLHPLPYRCGAAAFDDRQCWCLSTMMVAGTGVRGDHARRLPPK